ncbi:oxidoreductase FAD/NAD(P)-binding domain protein [mine drainage metagenome]|uniref:Oxidoreductase FAD/NAD(P)-binding domain protein n=2 Tax=mine drainage metagenome TaxID=410659 RepID=T1D1S5_9ZZZZ
MSRSVPTPRGSVLIEHARIRENQRVAPEQFQLLLESPRIAARAQPGTFVQVSCDEDGWLKRPMSLLDAWGDRLDILYKVVGKGTQRLSTRPAGTHLSIMGPIGNPFAPDPEAPWIIAIGGGTGIPPLIFLLERLLASGTRNRLAFFGGSELPFPLETQPRATPFIGIPEHASLSLLRLDRAGIPAALASRGSIRGTYPGLVTELFECWWRAQPEPPAQGTQVFSCGPSAMMVSVQNLALEMHFGGALCLEEYMACAIGGCAGCTVPITGPGGIAMKRVCVDGPVFPMGTVLFDNR